MDPLHLTEFASDRYFEKLHQLRDAQAAPAAGSSSQQPDGHAVEGPIPHNPFILPLRGATSTEVEEVAVRHVDQKEKIKEKRGFLSFRSKILHSKSQTQTQTQTFTSSEVVERRTSVAESTKQRCVPASVSRCRYQHPDDCVN